MSVTEMVAWGMWNGKIYFIYLYVLCSAILTAHGLGN